MLLLIRMYVRTSCSANSHVFQLIVTKLKFQDKINQTKSFYSTNIFSNVFFSGNACIQTLSSVSLSIIAFMKFAIKFIKVINMAYIIRHNTFNFIKFKKKICESENTVFFS